MPSPVEPYKIYYFRNCPPHSPTQRIFTFKTLFLNLLLIFHFFFRDEPLQFTLMGGQEKGFGIFIDKVEKGTKAAEIGLKRGKFKCLSVFNL